MQKTEAWEPFVEGRGGLFTNPVLAFISEQYGKTTAQARWMYAGGTTPDGYEINADSAKPLTSIPHSYRSIHPSPFIIYTNFPISEAL